MKVLTSKEGFKFVVSEERKNPSEDVVYFTKEELEFLKKNVSIEEFRFVWLARKEDPNWVLHREVIYPEVKEIEKKEEKKIEFKDLNLVAKTTCSEVIEMLQKKVIPELEQEPQVALKESDWAPIGLSFDELKEASKTMLPKEIINENLERKFNKKGITKNARNNSRWNRPYPSR